MRFGFFFEISADDSCYSQNFCYPNWYSHNREIFSIFCLNLTAEFADYECTADMLFVFFFTTMYFLDAVTARINFSLTTSAFELIIIELLICYELLYSLAIHSLLPRCLLYSYFSRMFSRMLFDSRMDISLDFLKYYPIRYWSAELLLHIAFCQFFANVALPSVFRWGNQVDVD